MESSHLFPPYHSISRLSLASDAWRPLRMTITHAHDSGVSGGIFGQLAHSSGVAARGRQRHAAALEQQLACTQVRGFSGDDKYACEYTYEYR